MVARAGLERDLELAHQVQMSFLPKKPPRLAGLRFLCALRVGPGSRRRITTISSLWPARAWASLLGDVAGKGVPAALLMAKVSSRRPLLHAYRERARPTQFTGSTN